MNSGVLSLPLIGFDLYKTVVKEEARISRGTRWPHATGVYRQMKKQDRYNQMN